MPLHHDVLYPHSSEEPPLTICYAPTNLEADDLIVEKLYAIKTPSRTLVVTSDNELKYRIKEVGAEVISAKSFISFLQKKTKTKNSSKKGIIETKKDLARLERIFTEKMEDNNQ